MIRILRIAYALLVAIFISSCINEEMNDGEYVNVGDRIPDFSVEVSDGTTVTGKQLRKGISFIMFFNTSCPDCQVTLPEAIKIYDEYIQKNVQFVFISREDNHASVSLYWKVNNIDLPYSAQATREIYTLFASSRIPRVYICADGIVKAIFTDNPNPTYADMDSVLRELI